jgi:hypothetical protein
MLKTPQLNSFLHRGEILSDGVTDVDTLASSEGAIANSIWNLFEGDALLDSTQTDAAGVSNLTIDRSTGSAPGPTTPAIASSGNTGATLASLNVDTALAVTVANGATVEIDGASAQSVTFAGTTGTLKIDDSRAFAGQVSGLTGSDALDLADVRYGANTTASFSGDANGGTLTVTDGTDTAHIALVGDYLTSGWTLSNDGHGGTSVIDPPLPGDGSANASTGTPQLPSLFGGLATRPSWQVAGVDYAVGIHSGTTLKDPTKVALPAGVVYDAANHNIVVTAARGTSVTLDGYDFSVAGGLGVVLLGASNGGGGDLTITNSNFAVGTNNQIPIVSEEDAGHLTVNYCVIDGVGTNNGVSAAQAVDRLIQPGAAGITAEYNFMKNAWSDGIDPSSGPIIVKYNVFDNANFSSQAHADWLQLNAAPGSSNTLDFEFNTAYQPANALFDLDSMVRVNMNVNNPVVAYNTAVAAHWINSWIVVTEGATDSPSQIINPSVHDNYLTYYPAIDTSWTMYDSAYPGGLINPNSYNNINLATGAT